MIKIYGCSDDLVEICGSVYKEDEIGCFDHDVRIRFFDGTIIRIGYPKKDLGVWWIEVEKQGTAKQALAWRWHYVMTKMTIFIVTSLKLTQRLKAIL